jgi:hypothetical protein
MALTEIRRDATQERSTLRALIVAEYQAKVSAAKRNTPRHELAARLAALRIEYLATLTALSMKVSQRARERRRAAMQLIAARQNQERLAASFRLAAKEVGPRKRGPEPGPHRPHDRMRNHPHTPRR